MKIDISYPEEQFSMVEDDLKEMADKLCREPKILQNVPINYSLIDTNITSIVGNYSNRNEYLRKLLCSKKVSIYPSWQLLTMNNLYFF